MEERGDFENALFFSLDQKKIGIEKLREFNEEKIKNNETIKKIYLKCFMNLEEFIKISEKREEIMINYFEKIEYNFKKKNFEKNEKEKFDFSELNKLVPMEKNNQLLNGINSFDNELEEFNKKLKGFKNQIRETILEKNLQKKKEENKRIRSISFERINLITSNIKKYISSAKKKFLKVIDLHENFLMSLLKKNQDRKMISRSSYNAEDLNLTKRSKVNLFENLMNYLLTMKIISDEIKKMNDFYLEFFEQTKNYEIENLISMKNSFFHFYNLYEETFGINQKFDISKNTFIQFDPQTFIKDNFDFEIFFDEEQKENIKNNLKINKIEHESLNQYIKNLNLFDYEIIYRYFIIKKFDAEFGKKTTDRKKVRIFLTLDYYITIYELMDDIEYELILNLPIEEIDLKIDFKKQELFLLFKEKGIFWNSQQKSQIFMPFEKNEEFFYQYEHFVQIFKNNSNQKKTSNSQISNTSANNDLKSKNIKSDISKENVKYLNNLNNNKKEQEETEENQESTNLICDENNSPRIPILINNLKETQIIKNSSEETNHNLKTNDKEEIIVNKDDNLFQENIEEINNPNIKRITGFDESDSEPILNNNLSENRERIKSQIILEKKEVLEIDKLILSQNNSEEKHDFIKESNELKIENLQIIENDTDNDKSSKDNIENLQIIENDTDNDESSKNNIDEEIIENDTDNNESSKNNIDEEIIENDTDNNESSKNNIENLQITEHEKENDQGLINEDDALNNNINEEITELKNEKKDMSNIIGNENIKITEEIVKEIKK